MEQLHSSGTGPELATEMSRIQLDMQMGNIPDSDRLIRVADGIDSAVNQWENLIARLKLSSDFQTREFEKLTRAHLDTHGTSVETIASMMRWQGGCMRALATDSPPPMPPPDLDLEAMMKQAQADPSKGPPSLTAMQAAETITASPFDPTKLDSPAVKEEYDKLVRDHSYLIEFGAKYAIFDPLGKIAYLDQVEAIEERWDVFFMRFQLMGALNSDYKLQCDQFLESMNIDEDDYRKLLKRCHELMREDAERERVA
jgi:hypothetical protein